MSSSVEFGNSEQAAINLFHPIYHSFSYPIGSRIDIERLLPTDLDAEDVEELIDNFSEPPAWVERFSPLAVQISDQVLRAKNAPELMLKIYRLMFDIFQGLGQFIESSLSQNLSEPIRFPFMSLALDPDTIHRLIETDYETGEAGYATLMKLFRQGTITPTLTIPFHLMLSSLDHEAEIRLCIRSAMIFYLRILRIYAEFLDSHGEKGLMVVPVWLPESAFSEKALQILNEEFQALCKKKKLGTGHLVVLLDNHQAHYQENDVLMKTWNQLEPNGAKANGNGRSGRKHDPSLHEAVQGISLLFRDRGFSDWVVHANPSVKKLLDRTIAKVDSDINAQNVHYGWAHFEELDAMTYNARAIHNFQQKLIKLTELGYLPLSPDFYVRGKLRGEFGTTELEPQSIRVLDPSAGNGWDLENAGDGSRWLGISQNGHAPTAEDAADLKSRPYVQIAKDGPIKKEGHPCWKIAWHQVRATCHRAVTGDPDALTGGMIEVLADLTHQKSTDKKQRNVEDFLANYTFVYWREHFIQHDVAEADINILELVTDYLRAGTKGRISEVDAAIAGTAAQAIYFALDSARSIGTGWENMDQRAFYQNVAMLTLAICNAIYVYHWLGDQKNARKLLNLLKTELLDFEGAYERYGLAKLAIPKDKWTAALASEVADSDDNVVRRAALRVAARHLRPLGYVREFTREHVNLTTNVGHLWSSETHRENLRYENDRFCGVSEA